MRIYTHFGTLIHFIAHLMALRILTDIANDCLKHKRYYENFGLLNCRFDGDIRSAPFRFAIVPMCLAVYSAATRNINESIIQGNKRHQE